MDFISAIQQYAWIGWIVLIAVFLIIEMLSLDFTFLMVGIGSVAGLVSGLVGAPIWLQVVVAAITAALLILLLRPPLLRRLHRGEDPTPSNVAALIGLRGQVLATVTAIGGQVKLSNGDIWTARADAASEFAPGTTVDVVRIDGATAFVRPAEEHTSA